MSQVIVLDTHIWIWLVNGNLDRFPASWLPPIEESDRLGVSPLSCYEIALAQQRGRLELDCTAQEWIRQALSLGKIDLLPITDNIAVQAVRLSPVHKDPFDRLIIATALAYNAQLASVDHSFRQYPELEKYLMRE
ncbi:MAG: type II toxin-antitoxin system VapC family toxin [Oscillatoriaceae cyanobacterium]